MSIGFEVFPRQALVVVTYTGVAGIEESARAMAELAEHPDAGPGHKHLVDLSGLTGVEEDYPKLLAFQARVAGDLGRAVWPAMLVFIAPNPHARHMVRMIYKSWDGIEGPPLATVETEAEGLALCGCRETRLRDLARQSSDR